jgi:hypothetical protein
MKINPYQFWYPGHNSIYYNNVERGALVGPTQGDASRINAGAIRNWVQPVATPSCIIHIKREQV